MKTRLNIYVFISLAFLVILTSNASACWEKYIYYNSGTASTSKSNSYYACADISNYASQNSVLVWATTEVEPYHDPTNDNLQASATLEGAYCSQNYMWEGEGPAPSHTFEITWNENFFWILFGNADNNGSGTGETHSGIFFQIDYLTYATYGWSNHDVEFDAYSHKSEGGSWSNLLELCWNPVDDDVDLEWDDSALGSDNTYADGPASGEYADNKSWSEDAYTSLGYVLTDVTLEGHNWSNGYDNAVCACTDYHAGITNYDLSY